jgi:serine/threonine-protein kinase
MSLHRHAFVARLARQRGFLDSDRFTAAMAALSARVPAEDEPFEHFWVEGGWLEKDQLDQLLSPPQTRRYTQPLEKKVTPPPEPEKQEKKNEERVPDLPRYETLRLVGMGGMGDVWEVVDKHLDRRVALKVPRKGADESIAKALSREARVVGSLEHPSIIPVYDAGQAEGVGPYYAMRLLEQPTLEDVISWLAQGDDHIKQSYSLGRLLRYYIQICEAVHYAHSRGIVHCDLKPANIVVGDFGEILILDWGLAFHVGEGIANRGGTPGYMSPEQLRAGAIVGPPADVFSLGAMLYEIVTLHPAYEGESVTDLMMQVAADEVEFPSPPPPREKKADVPLELEWICLKAMAVDPEHRHATCAELAGDVEAFLEGTRERERRQKRADELTAQGEQLADMYREYCESRPRVVDDVTRIRAATAPSATAEHKRDLWDAEDRLAATDAVGVRTFQAAVAGYEQALDEMGGHRAARAGLASLYALEVHRARERRDELNRIYFEELVKQYSDGSPLLLRPEGRVRIRCLHGEGQVFISEYEEQERRLIAVRERPLGEAPCDVALPAGSYLLRIGRIDGGSQVSCPVLITNGCERDLEIDLAVLDTLAPDERYVPGGPALLGGDELSPWGNDLQLVEVGPFVLSERPVTFAEYLAFLSELPGDERERQLPMNTAGVPHWRWDGEKFVPSPNFNFAREEALLLPAFGVTLDSAQAYTAWKLLKTGDTYRLPREDEWEKAARGVDGRIHPWGDYFDASFCKMVQSRPGPPRPEPSGAFTADVSPYGIRDLAGGVADWVVTGDPRADVARGGAWCDWRADCRLPTRRPYQIGIRTSRVGFRLARDP